MWVHSGRGSPGYKKEEGLCTFLHIRCRALFFSLLENGRTAYELPATVRSFPGKKWYGGQGPLTDSSQFLSCLAALL
jgi:hypothetical protein